MGFVYMDVWIGDEVLVCFIVKEFKKVIGFEIMIKVGVVIVEVVI